ncbi:rhombosortase [Piscinibacter sp.]|uniref:rhombosortase n=1 Tax=Piscinibacter sp. TaxID=1903157 RepID=UPI002CCF32B5|nr:rhombosortase [Albitalea sp.]HUG21589.1 rhombosortase [Albitalea sp.]
MLTSSINSELIDWQPALAARQPWRAWTAVFVHYSGLHLAANLAGAALVGALGLVARLPLRAAAAWFVAWPLTQLGLLAQPELLHYGGLSGVLHAGVAVIAVQLLWTGDTRQRRIGAAIVAGLALKLLSEAPWDGPLRRPAGWDIAIAPLAHTSGAIAGAICALMAQWQHRRRAPPTMRADD